MLSNRYISQTMSEDLLKLYADLESDLIVAYSKTISKDSFTSVWIRNRALAVRELRKELEKTIRKYNPKISKVVYDTLNDTSFKALESDERFYRKAVEKGLLEDIGDIIDSKALKDMLDKSYELTMDNFKKMNSTAIMTTANKTRINRALNDIVSGAFTKEEGIRKAVNELTEQGITGIVFDSGRRMGLVEYARMTLTTSSMQCTRDLVNERMQEYGIDLVAISQHSGARPKCYPYQGRIFVWGERTSKYPSIFDTSYGEPDGLFGINCRHYYTPYIEEMGIYKEDKIKEKENNLLYERTQEQRNNERMIRKYKRQAEGLKGAGLDNSRAMSKVREWQSKQRKFIEANNLTRQYVREQV